MNKVVILILLDAFRWDYINEKDTPFLWGLTQNSIYVRKLKSGFSFCERSEIFTGCYSDKTNNFTAIAYNPGKSPFKSLRKVFDPSSDFLDNRFFENIYMRKIISRALKILNIDFPIFRIPYKLLPYFALTEDLKKHTDENAFGVQSIFDIMKNQNLSIFYDSFTALGMYNGSDDDRIKLLINNIISKKNLYLLYIGEADSVGHYYGTQSFERRLTTANIDKKIRLIFESFSKYFKSLRFLIVGDHGMIDIIEYFDVWDEIKSLCRRTGLIHGKDFFMFLDSTMARFWFLNEKAKKEIMNMLSGRLFKKMGVIISPQLAKKFHIPIPSNLYGQLVWWANPGIIISSNYFQRDKRIKAMHGYNTELDQSKGFCIITGNDLYQKTIEEGELIDICPTLCECLGINEPKNNQGKSLLSYSI